MCRASRIQSLLLHATRLVASLQEAASAIVRTPVAPGLSLAFEKLA
jgi:hypothetical protein